MNTCTCSSIDYMLYSNCTCTYSCLFLNTCTTCDILRGLWARLIEWILYWRKLSKLCQLHCVAVPHLFLVQMGYLQKYQERRLFVFVFFQISMDCIVHGGQKMESTQKIYGSRYAFSNYCIFASFSKSHACSVLITGPWSHFLFIWIVMKTRVALSLSHSFLWAYTCERDGDFMKQWKTIVDLIVS